MITLGPIKRRVLYVTLFEIFAVMLTTFILVVLSGSDTKQSLILAVIIAITAVVWNFIYNTLFEYWERRNQIKARTFKIRSVHAIFFEGGLTLVCLPLYMFWYGVGIWTALTMEISLTMSFLVYTFVFTLLFDKVFTLPYQAIAAEKSA
ncbi:MULTISPECIES: PACE efflux transporter [unclassified Psychrobacter]|uniref:PACE efflux transporter n=1 Tax=unclassified Psychrobacter TaxID=196806 RepID=UPI00083167E8|nr:PACE efflux transporter [Psychrobacter sp. P11G5]